MLSQFVDSFLRFLDDVYFTPVKQSTQPRTPGPRCGSYYRTR